MSPKVQRIAIFVIALVMIAGTLGSFALMVLSTNNQKTDIERQTEELQRAQQEQQQKAAELSSKYYPTFKEYRDHPAAFDGSAVGSEVEKKDLKEGTGDVITNDSSYAAYYMVWTPSGTAFESSFEGDSLGAPINVTPGRLIPGWHAGVEGMKVGGIREITIPASLAYGESGKGEDVPPNTPLKFLVYVAEKS